MLISILIDFVDTTTIQTIQIIIHPVHNNQPSIIIIQIESLLTSCIYITLNRIFCEAKLELKYVKRNLQTWIESEICKPEAEAEAEAEAESAKQIVLAFACNKNNKMKT